MSQMSQPKRVFEFLKKNPNQKFKANEIAVGIIEMFSDDYTSKRKNPRFKTDEEFKNQVLAEIGAQKDRILNESPNIHVQDKPRPRVFWYDPNEKYEKNSISDENDQIEDIVKMDDENQEVLTLVNKTNFTEHELYPILISYLKSEFGLFCLRINEKRSINNKGQNGNQWLHPDIVAMQTLDQKWNELVKACVKQGSGQNVRLWSFEVKKELNGSNVRSSYFQAVSNSSWANEGYLVATSISNSDVEEELRMLSSLHGIGVILLQPNNPTESEIFLPAKRRQEADWQSINRILSQNSDFKNFIQLVASYYGVSGQVTSTRWE